MSQGALFDLPAPALGAGAGRDVLAIVGSRRFAVSGGCRRALQRIVDELHAHRPDLVISGESPGGGVDLLAKLAAYCYDIDYRGFPPTRAVWAGPGGFADRNRAIARACSRMLVVRCRYSRSYGSGWTGELAEAYRRPVTWVHIP